MNLRGVTIQTQRLKLVSKTADFAQDIFKEYREPVIKYMNHDAPESLDVLVQRLKDAEHAMEQGKQLFVVVLNKESNEFLGCMSLSDFDSKNPEMGGWLKEDAHGHGYGREAAAGLKKWADEHLTYEHLLWPCAEENVASCKLAESFGAKVHRKYAKTNARGLTWEFIDYLIPRKNESG